MFTHGFPLPGELRTTRFHLDQEHPARALIVLCHGWHGHLTKTWGNLVASHRRGDLPDGTDLLFLGYPRTPASVDILARWIVDKLRTVFPCYRLGGGFERRYASIHLVGHSLGAIAIRRAALIVHRLSENEEWAVDVGAIGLSTLYAPPLCGVDWEAYLKDVPPGPARLLSVWRRWRERVGDDLKKDAPFLLRLRKETEEVLQRSVDLLPATHLVLGVNDAVVLPAEVVEEFGYSADTSEQRGDRGHCDVSKFDPPEPDVALLARDGGGSGRGQVAV